MFLQNKYTTYYYNIINNAKNQVRKKLPKNHIDYVYYEKHHIIPNCMSGKELVLLTAKEHYICHLLLVKMTEGQIKHKMINALIKMTFSKSKGQERFTSRTYSLVRNFIAQKNSEIFKGKEKSLETRKRMSEGRKGMKFSDSHKLNLSIAVKKRNLVGSKNPFYGKKHTEENKRKWAENSRRVHLGNTVAKGRKWYTNHISSKMCYEGTQPIGWVPGRVKWK